MQQPVQITHNKIPETRHKEGALSGIEVTLDQAERETLEIMLKEIILNLPLDTESDEELYRSDIPTEREQFKLNLYGYEMRALRTLLQKVR
ncbi:MAG: hypothetical protein GY754_07950 [bacterium]|nr:hypothetical protein [bacterium]